MEHLDIGCPHCSPLLDRPRPHERVNRQQVATIRCGADPRTLREREDRIRQRFGTGAQAERIWRSFLIGMTHLVGCGWHEAAEEWIDAGLRTPYSPVHPSTERYHAAFAEVSQALTEGELTGEEYQLMIVLLRAEHQLQSHGLLHLARDRIFTVAPICGD